MQNIIAKTFNPISLIQNQDHVPWAIPIQIAHAI